ncbi:MAG TPA: hypothetical protein VM890_04105 [Longimicrobium sp.]|nr:hypothetical protein [Longimicrobium sp.]
MRLPLLIVLAAVPAVLPAHAAAQRYARPVGDPSAVDTTVAFVTGDVIRVTTYPRMATGIELCGTVARGLQGGKLMFARTDAETNSAQQAVVSFPSSGAMPLCQRHRPSGGDWLVVTFARPVRDEVGRIARITVGQVVLPRAPLEGKRVTFTWTREGPFDVRSTTPAPDTLGPPRRP